MGAGVEEGVREDGVREGGKGQGVVRWEGSEGVSVHIKWVGWGVVLGCCRERRMEQYRGLGLCFSCRATVAVRCGGRDVIEYVVCRWVLHVKRGGHNFSPTV